MSDAVELSLLERALTRLEEALVAYQDRPKDEFVRDSIIQRFEFTYELTYVTLRRYLEEAANAGEKVDRMSFPTMIRTASEQGLLLNGWDVWEGFRKARNKTSHTYNEETAIEVVAKMPDFAAEARHLLNADERKAALRMPTERIHLEPKWCELVAAILLEHVPARAVWAFGSRATGRRVKRFSDLDLAIEGRLTLHESAVLCDAFEESMLPIKVDVVELGAITPEFRARIEKDFVLVQEGSRAVAAFEAREEARP